MSPLDRHNAIPVALASRWVTPSRTPYVDNTVWTLTAIAVVFLTLRLWTRLKANHSLFADDWLLISATILIVGHAPICCWFSRVLFDGDDINLHLYATLAEVNVLLYSLTQLLSKTSIAVVLSRCTTGWYRWTTWGLTGVIDGMLIPHAILGFGIICGQDPVYAQWSIPGPCINYPRLKDFKIAIQVVSVIVDVWFTALPWKIVWNLKLRAAERFGFAFAMSLGTGTCVIGVIRLHQWLNLSMADPKDVDYQTATITLWNFTEPVVTVIAACLPVLRVPTLALIRRLRGHPTTAGIRATTNPSQHNLGYMRTRSLRQSSECSLAYSPDASQHSLRDGIVVKQDFMVHSEPLDFHLHQLKSAYKPC